MPEAQNNPSKRKSYQVKQIRKYIYFLGHTPAHDTYSHIITGIVSCLRLRNRLENKYIFLNKKINSKEKEIITANKKKRKNKNGG